MGLNAILDGEFVVPKGLSNLHGGSLRSDGLWTNSILKKEPHLPLGAIALLRLAGSERESKYMQLIEKRRIIDASDIAVVTHDVRTVTIFRQIRSEDPLLDIPRCSTIVNPFGIYGISMNFMDVALLDDRVFGVPFPGYEVKFIGLGLPITPIKSIDKGLPLFVESDGKSLYVITRDWSEADLTQMKKIGGTDTANYLTLLRGAKDKEGAGFELYRVDVSNEICSTEHITSLGIFNLDIITAFAQCNPNFYLATSEGIVMYDGKQLQEVSFEKDPFPPLGCVGLSAIAQKGQDFMAIVTKDGAKQYRIEKS